MKYNSEEYRKFEQERKAAGKLIDPATAEMTVDWAQVLDPYGVLDDLPDEANCVGRAYFVRAPNSDIWIDIRDLPDATLHEVRQRLEAGYYMEDLDLELYGRRGEHLRQCFYRQLETQLQAVGQLLGSMEGETAKFELADQVRQLRLELAKSQMSLASLAESQTGLAESRQAIARLRAPGSDILGQRELPELDQ
jgi:hypothetical protein